MFYARLFTPNTRQNQDIANTFRFSENQFISSLEDLSNGITDKYNDVDLNNIVNRAQIAKVVSVKSPIKFTAASISNKLL